MSIPDSWAPNFGGHSDGKCFGPKMVLKIPKSDLSQQDDDRPKGVLANTFFSTSLK